MSREIGRRRAATRRSGAIAVGRGTALVALLLAPLLLCGCAASGVPAPRASAPQADGAPRSAAAARVADAAVASARATEPLRAFMAARRIPGLSVAVGQHGQLVWAEAFGLADGAAATPVTSDSVFPIGSTSKVLTSLAVGQLREAGKLDLDAPIGTYVPYFPAKEHTLTPRLLAGHLSGLRDYAAGEYANQRAFGSVAEAVAVFAADPLLFEPGTRYAYSAYNFVLLSAAIEGASGQGFLDYVHERIVAPLGLAHTGPDHRAVPPPGRVTSYVAGWGGAPVAAPAVDVSNKWAAGGFVSTPSDMVRLGNAILAGRVVGPETFTLLTTPQKLADGSETGEGYAMGWRSGRRRFAAAGRELRVVHHGGAANGGMSFFVILPEVELVVALQTNLLFSPFGPFADAAYGVADAFLAGAGGAPGPGSDPGDSGSGAASARSTAW